MTWKQMTHLAVSTSLGMTPGTCSVNGEVKWPCMMRHSSCTSSWEERTSSYNCTKQCQVPNHLQAPYTTLNAYFFFRLLVLRILILHLATTATRNPLGPTICQQSLVCLQQFLYLWPSITKAIIYARWREFELILVRGCKILNNLVLRMSF